jgi:cation transport ATPase
LEISQLRKYAHENKFKEKEVLVLAASVGSGSEHPLAQAIVRAGRAEVRNQGCRA